MLKKMEDEKIIDMTGTIPIPDEETKTVDTYSYRILNAQSCNKHKMEFYKLKDTSIRLRLKFKPEYEFIGRITELSDGTVTLKDVKTPEVIIGLNEIDPETICPLDINPILVFNRVIVPNEQRERIFKRDNYLCSYKFDGCLINKQLEIDHIVPVSLGGANTDSNLITSCSNCNKRKGNKIISSAIW